MSTQRDVAEPKCLAIRHVQTLKRKLPGGSDERSSEEG